MEFGSSVRGEWRLEPGLVYLNHGTVGVTPAAVLEAQAEIRRAIETNPSRHILREIVGMLGEPAPGRLRAAVERAAVLFGARAEDVVPVENATTGVNAVLHSLGLGEGDKVVIAETTYGGVREAVRHACRLAGAQPVSVRLPHPIRSPEAVLEALDAALPSGPGLAILDHIVSETGAVLPVRELVRLCRERGLRVLIDGAHAPGQIQLDVPSYGADAYVGNLHKWAFAPRSCGLLWVAPELQPRMHPVVVSWNLDQGFAAEFEWTGTRDPSAFLAVPAALDFLDRLDFEALRKYNHGLLWRGVEWLNGLWDTSTTAGEKMSAFMTAVELPPRFEATPANASRLRDALLFEHRIEAPVFEFGGRLWVRLSVQVYNEFRDFERLAEALDAL
ncbi:MAG: aminotransferase class V-fold PLP-dependent enzyme [Proteobacteria bacterium]|nr:aminotransferase class V-fold PLP-dependent enzyme [Pseudomonadota bacterium]